MARWRVETRPTFASPIQRRHFMPEGRVLTRLTRLAGFDREPAAARARPLRASQIGRNAALRGLRATGFRLRARHRHTNRKPNWLARKRISPNRKPNWLARNRNWLARKAPAYQPQADLACAQPDFARAQTKLVGRPGSDACAWGPAVGAWCSSAGARFLLAGGRGRQATREGFSWAIGTPTVGRQPALPGACDRADGACTHRGGWRAARYG